MGKEVQHLIRAVILLVAIVAGIVLVRQAMIPKTFGEFGYYRGENVAEWSSRSPIYSLTSNCNNCHANNYSRWTTSKHAAVSCENCHGPGSSHIESGKPLVVNKASSLCLTCHERLVSRPSAFPQVSSSNHGAALSCTTCHNPHDPSIKDVPAIPHSIEGIASCGTCHGRQGIVPKPQNHVGRTDDTCLLCHVSSPVPTPTATPFRTAPVATPTPMQVPVRTAGPPMVPHSLEGRSECLACHQSGALGAKVVPADHAGRVSNVCLLCHKGGSQ